MPVPVNCNIEEDPIKNEQFFSGAQGQVIPMSMDGCGRNSNPSEILCLSWLSVCLRTIRSKVRVLLCPQLCLHYKFMGKIFAAQGYATPERIVRDSMLSKLKALPCPQHFSGAEGQVTVTPKSIDGCAGIRTRARFYGFPCYLQV